MSMNKYMHPRNIYKTSPDYTELAIKYEDFRQVCMLELDGTVSIDMRSKDSLKILTKCLLRRDFNLDIDFPDDHLIPTVPLRLNYILWLEDIIGILKCGNQTVSGIDIGCGASCIYSLLAACKNSWQMTALEINRTNIEFAQENITRNHLIDLVNVFHQTDKSVIFKDFFATRDGSEIFTFCLCNPPFFELENSRSPDKKETRRQPANVATGMADELACEGGEVAFVRRIIEDSLQFKDRIKIFTSMLGQKTSLISVLKILREYHISNCIQTEFCQGNTTRWGVAWSFDGEILLRLVPSSQSSGFRRPPDKAFSLSLTTLQSFEDCRQHFDKIFSDIRLKFESRSETENMINAVAKAYSDQWSNMRRKRRLGESSKDFLKSVSETEDDTHKEPILTFEIDISYELETKELTIKLVYLDGSAEAIGLYKLFQFIKNNCTVLEKRANTT